MEGFGGVADAQTNALTIENLVPGTAYAIYVSGLLTSGIQTDTSAGRFESLEILSPIVAEKVRSTSATLSWPQNNILTSWDIVIDDENVQVINIADNRVELLNLYPEESYTVTLVGILDEISLTDEISMTLTAAPMGPEVDIRNVQSTAFNILWSAVDGAKGYEITIFPPVDDFENGKVIGNDDNYVSIYEAEPDIQYSVSVSACFEGANVRTDNSYGAARTAVTLAPPEVLEISENSAIVQWEKTLHHADEHEGSGIPVAFDYDQSDIEVINYRLSIKYVFFYFNLPIQFGQKMSFGPL